MRLRKHSIVQLARNPREEGYYDPGTFVNQPCYPLAVAADQASRSVVTSAICSATTSFGTRLEQLAIFSDSCWIGMGDRMSAIAMSVASSREIQLRRSTAISESTNAVVSRLYHLCMRMSDIHTSIGMERLGDVYVTLLDGQRSAQPGDKLQLDIMSSVPD